MAETKTKRSRREESAADALADNAANVLFTLPSANIVHGTLSQRPSKAIRSPYVADALVKTEDGIDVPVLAHTPMLDMGGLCVPGAELIMTANDNAATSLDALIAAARRQKSTDDDDGASASSSPEKEPSVPKTTTKTNVSVQLVRSREPESNGNCLIGAHPSLGNKLAFAILELFPSAVLDGVAPPGSRIVSIGKEVTLKLRNRHKMRADFVCDVTDSAQNNNSQHRVVVEVKNVVCADYKASTAPERKDCVFVSHADDYQRTGIFPWGSVKQEFEGRKVVSTRACEHVRTLTSIAQGKLDDEPASGPSTKAVLLLIVNRGDCSSCRACHEACPVWAEEVRQAMDAGVHVIAVGIRWRDDGTAIYRGRLPFSTPS